MYSIDGLPHTHLSLLAGHVSVLTNVNNQALVIQKLPFYRVCGTVHSPYIKKMNLGA